MVSTGAPAVGIGWIRSWDFTFLCWLGSGEGCNLGLQELFGLVVGESLETGWTFALGGGAWAVLRWGLKLHDGPKLGDH